MRASEERMSLFSHWGWGGCASVNAFIQGVHATLSPLHTCSSVAFNNGVKGSFLYASITGWKIKELKDPPYQLRGKKKVYPIQIPYRNT